MPLASNDELKDRGWEEPLNGSPIDAPDGWGQGSVVHTGGGIYCRVWSTKTEAQSNADDPDPDTYYEAAYGREFDGVTIEVYEYREDSGLWERCDELARSLCSDKTDSACAETALKLMEAHDPPQSTD